MLVAHVWQKFVWGGPVCLQWLSSHPTVRAAEFDHGVRVVKRYLCC